MERTFREFDEILILLLELELSLQGPVPHDQVAVSFALLISSCRQKVVRVAYRHSFFCRAVWMDKFVLICNIGTCELHIWLVLPILG